jgi:RNA polymerase sigma-70 factor (ECF subfamily)
MKRLEKDVRALTDMNDEELGQLAKENYEAFDVLYRRYAVPVYRYCYARTDSVADAEDLTAQIFLGALEGIRRYRGRGRFSAWLFGIARNKCADFYRGQYKEQSRIVNDETVDFADPSDAVNPEMRVYTNELLECVKQNLNITNQSWQDALRLRYWAGLSIADIANIMQRSQGAVKMLISRAISDLKQRCVKR